MSSADSYGIIYCLVFPNGKSYVGQAVWSQRRTRPYAHVRDRGENAYLCDAMREYGEESVRYHLMDLAADDRDLNEKEEFWIAVTGSLHPFGYNLMDGPNGTACVATRKKQSVAKTGTKRSPEACAAVSAGHKGIKFRPERCAKISAAKKGIRFTAEHRQKLSTAKKKDKSAIERCRRLAAAMKGTKHSAEHRAKVGIALRGKKRSPEATAATAAALKGRKLTPESIVKRTASRKANGVTNQYGRRSGTRI